MEQVENHVVHDIGDDDFGPVLPVICLVASRQRIPTPDFDSGSSALGLSSESQRL